ncbi:MAG: sodium:calcium antiporter, partial [Candidatus Jordarchaeaceae archaeon]
MEKNGKKMTAFILLSFIMLIGSIFIIYLGSKIVVYSAGWLASCLKMQKVIVGSVFVASVTSLPELLSSIFAVFFGTSNMAFGNIIGSNIYNIPLIVGICGLIGEYKIKNCSVGKECLFMISLAAIMTGLIVSTGMVTWWIGAVFLALYPMFIFYSVRKGNGFSSYKPVKNKAKLMVSMLGGGAALLGGTFLLVYSIINITEAYGLMYFYTGLTVMALGCIVPETAVSISAALRGEQEISIGNVIGDNLITMTLGFGVIGLIKPFTVSLSEVLYTMPFMILITFILYVMSKSHKITRRW